MAGNDGNRGKNGENDRMRMFSPFPPQVGSRAKFAETWWGQAWVDALETTSLDEGRLSRGRTYARRGAVEGIAVRPGLAQARVQGSRSRPYRAEVRITELSDKDWERFLDTVASRAVHIAALLDRDVPPELIDDAEAAGVRLLPAYGDLEPDCDCPDWGWPCKHAAALCYQLARLLDVDPFVLLLLRGRGEQELMEELRTRNAKRAATAAAEAAVGAVGAAVGAVAKSAAKPAAVAAKAAFASWLPPTEPFPEPERVVEAGLGPMLSTTVAPTGFDPSALEALAADAASRARMLLDAYLDGEIPALLPELTVWQDTVRVVSHDFIEGADAKLAMAVRAWQLGGVAGLAVLEEAWTPSPAEKARALAGVGDDEELPPLKTWRNRWTAAPERAQARLGQDGRWWPFECDDDGRWWPVGPAEHDLAAALSTVLD